MSEIESKLSPAESAKLEQELLAYGYMRENFNASFDTFPETLIPIIIAFINCILDLVYDKTINHGKYIWYSDKKIELKHFIYMEGMGGVAIIDRVFNKELCRNFRIDFRITFGEEKKAVFDENNPDDFNFQLMNPRINQTVTPAFRLGYVTRFCQGMKHNLKNDIRYEQLGNQSTPRTYGIGVTRSGIAMYHDTKYNRTDTDFKFHKELEEEDVISLFFSFETNTSAIYHNDEKVGDYFKHESEDIENIYPALSMWSWENEALVARVEIMCCILNVSE